MKELRELCRKFNLPVAGLKEDLIRRILKHANQIEKDLTAEPSNSTRTRITIISGMKGKITNLFQSSSNVEPNSLQNSIQSSNANDLTERFSILHSTIPNICMRCIKFLFANIPRALGMFGGIFAMMQIYNAQNAEILILSGRPFSMW